MVARGVSATSACWHYCALRDAKLTGMVNAVAMASLAAWPDSRVSPLDGGKLRDSFPVPVRLALRLRSPPVIDLYFAGVLLDAIVVQGSSTTSSAPSARCGRRQRSVSR